MSLNSHTRRTLSNRVVDDLLVSWTNAFLTDRKTQGVANGTMRFYTQKIKLFLDFCDTREIERISQLTPTTLRQYLLQLEADGHKPGGKHAAFRTLRVFLYWYENEVEPPDWSNPIRKVRAPKVPIEPLEPVSFETVSELVAVCPHDTFMGDRDVAIFPLPLGYRRQGQ